VGGPSSEETPFSPEIFDWGREHLKKVAARFPHRYREELEAELAATLIGLKYRPPPRIRNWKAYLSTCLSNRALSLVKKWRTHERREISPEFIPESAGQPSPAEEWGPQELESHHVLSQARRVLDAEAYALLKLLADFDGNQSRVARLLGTHRNTIRRRLQRIRRILVCCPIENVTGRLQLTSQQEKRLAQMALAGNTTTREMFKARLILALSSGQSYAQIAERLHTTRPTIARWRHRFEDHGIDGLKARHAGRKPDADRRRRLANWRRTIRRTGQPSGRWTYRTIARTLGISKSTVHRILHARVPLKS
jgi:DNA-directed RNA polymerase specialized sigma24 family protein/transposase-like protein